MIDTAEIAREAGARFIVDSTFASPFLCQPLQLGVGIQVIDVREPNEFEIARIPSTKLIPLAQVVNRAEEIDPRRTTVVHCKGGVRSAKAIEALKKEGFKGRLINLKGGIMAWSNEVDPSVPKY